MTFQMIMTSLQDRVGIMNLRLATFCESSSSCGREAFILCVYIFQSLKSYCAHQSVLCFPLLNHLATWTMYHQPSADCQPHKQNQIAFMQARGTNWWFWLQCMFVCLVLNYISEVRNHIPKSKQVTGLVTTNQFLNGIKIKLPLCLVHIWE